MLAPVVVCATHPFVQTVFETMSDSESEDEKQQELQEQAQLENGELLIKGLIKVLPCQLYLFLFDFVLWR